ncbi:MAG: T9SS type A sorting domain-containing protein [Ignavibacteriae bacterium]|nr:T9SS type A sorting domain-containing protein [Ignavibacteriota bacterium]
MKTTFTKSPRLLVFALPVILFFSFGLMQILFDSNTPENVQPSSLQKKEGYNGRADVFKKYFEDWYAPYKEYEPGLQKQAAQQIQTMPTEDQRIGKKGKSSRLAMSHSPWVQKGPWGVRNEYMDPPVYYSGRITTIDYHPSTGYYVGTAEGGLWAQAAFVFVPLTEKLPSLSIGAVAVDPSDADRIYLGTGEYQGFPGTGVYRSTNGGASWEPLVIDNMDDTPKRVSKILVAPWDNNIVFVACNEGLYRTSDKGDTWKQVGYASISDVATNPSGTFMLMGTPGDRVSKSTNFGLNWSIVTDLPVSDVPIGEEPTSQHVAVGRISVAISKSSPSTAYVQIGDKFRDSVMGVYKTTNAGGNWTNITPPPSALTNGKKNYLAQQRYNNVVAIHPTNANIVWLGGVWLLRSSNGGSSWNQVGVTNTGQWIVHPDNHALFYKDANTFVVGNDGGFFTTSDEGVTWNSNVNRLLPITQFYNVAIETFGGKVRYGGAQDNGIIGSNPDFPDDWIYRKQGDGIDVAFNPASASIIYHVLNYSDPYWRVRSDNQGTSWAGINYGIDTNHRKQDFWGTYIVPSKTSGSKIFTNAGHYIYMSTDRGNNWTMVLGTNSYGVAGHFDVNYGDNFIYVPNKGAKLDGSANDRLSGLAYDSSSKKWSRLDIGIGLPNSTIKKVRTSIEVSATAYVLANSPFRQVWKTTNKGQTWTDISSNLPDYLPVNDILEDPLDTDHLIVGTDKGAFASDDAGASWYRWNTGMPEAVRILDIDISYHDGNFYVFAGTFGRSTFERKLYATEPAAFIPPKRLNFGTVSRGGRTFDTVRVTNIGAEILEISGVQISDPDITISPLSASIAAGESRVFTVYYNPSRKIYGARQGTIEFLHNGEGDSRIEVQAYVGNSEKFRSFIPENLTAKKAEKRKETVSNWEFHFENNNPTRNPAHALVVEFKNAVSELVSSSPFGKTSANKAKRIWTFSEGDIAFGNFAVIKGINLGTKGQEVKRWWWVANLVDWNEDEERMTEGVLGVINGTKFPESQVIGAAMPNTANLREELFVEYPFSKSNPLIIGVKDSFPKEKRVAWVAFEKPADLLSSLLPGTRGVQHNGLPRWFDSLANGREMIGAYKKLPPQMQSNKLFAELVALKINIIASKMEKTPLGFGELKFQEGGSRFDGKTVGEISAMADTFMTYGNVEKIGSAAELYGVIRKIDSAFSGANDTLSFYRKLRFTGVREIEEVQFLVQDPSIEPVVHTSGIVFTEVPDEFTLYQNYPNPFNPTTNFGFRISDFGLVTLTVYNSLGQEIATVLNRQAIEAGEYEFLFEASTLPSGVYFYRLTVESEDEEGVAQTFTDAKKMLLLR